MKCEARFKAIIFDFGGTIESDGLNWIRRFHHLYEEKNIHVPLHQFYDFIRSLDIQLINEENIRNYNLSTLVKCHIDYQLQNFDKLNLSVKPDKNFRKHIYRRFLNDTNVIIERNRPLIEKLSKLFNLGIVSNFYGNLDIVLKKYRLIKYFKVVVDSQVVGYRKPDPSIFLLAAKKLDVSPQEILFVGDSYAMDIRPTLKIGFGVVWMKHPEVDLTDPNITTIKSFPDFFDLVMDHINERYR